MASITIRNLDDEVKTRLRMRAAGNGRSMEEEARLILGEAVGPQDRHPEPRERYPHPVRAPRWGGTGTAAARAGA